MIRLQIQLDGDQVRGLKRTAEEDGVSQAEVIRRALAAYLEERRRPDPAAVQRGLAVVGRGSSGIPDLAQEHDRDLGASTAERLSGRAVGR